MELYETSLMRYSSIIDPINNVLAGKTTPMLSLNP